MPRYLIQTESGSWYQVDTEEPKVLRLSSRSMRGATRPSEMASDAWQDVKAVQMLPSFRDADSGPAICYPGHCLRFVVDDGAVVTTSPVIFREIIENLSKRRAVPFEKEAAHA